MQGWKLLQRAHRLLGCSNQVKPVRNQIFHFQLRLKHFLVSAA